MSFNICNLLPESCHVSEEMAKMDNDPPKMEKMDSDPLKMGIPAKTGEVTLPPSSNVKLLEDLKRSYAPKLTPFTPTLPSSPPSLHPSPVIGASLMIGEHPPNPQTLLYLVAHQQQMLARVNLAAHLMSGGHIPFRRFGHPATPMAPFPSALTPKYRTSLDRAQGSTPGESVKSDGSPNHQKRTYYCQRCLNHNLRYKRKDHKNQCLYQKCTCEDCIMVDKRRDLNKKLHQLEEMENRVSLRARQTTPTEGADGNDRKPNCQKCFQHGITTRLKNHKRVCPFKLCPCKKCMVVQERQKLMADQIKLRRKQKKLKEMRDSQEFQLKTLPADGFPMNRMPSLLTSAWPLEVDGIGAHSPLSQTSSSHCGTSPLTIN